MLCVRLICQCAVNFDVEFVVDNRSKIDDNNGRN